MAMNESFFERIGNFISKKSVVQRLAKDPALVSELLLLVRLVFVDGEKHQAEMNALLQIMHDEFEIMPDELPEVGEYLKTFAYETSNEQAAAMFRELAPERRQALIRHLVTIARADSEIHPAETSLIARVVVQLDVNHDELFGSPKVIASDNEPDELV